MKPYQASGKHAQWLLAAHANAVRAHEQQRLVESLRSFKFVINALGGAAIVLTPTVGAITASPTAAFMTAAIAVLVMSLLEILERRVKRELCRMRASA